MSTIIRQPCCHKCGTLMEHRCYSCGKLMGWKSGTLGGVTHGACRPCAQQYIDEHLSRIFRDDPERLARAQAILGV